MKEEKLMILSMLEAGKITSEEAVKLLEALEEIEDPVNKDYAKHNVGEEKYKKLTNKTLEEIGLDIGNAFSNMVNGLRDIGSSIGFNINSETINLDLEKDITHIENPILDLKAVNGSIRLNKINSNNLLIKVSCQYKNGLLDKNKEFYNFYLDGNRIVFTPIYNSDISIKLDVFLPDKEYKEIILNSTNGKIDVQDFRLNILNCITTNGSINSSLINAKEMNLSTKNGRIECKNINSNKIKATTTNSSIILMDVVGIEIDAVTANSRINLNNIETEQLVCKTANGTIDVQDITSEIIYLTTSNSKIICNNIDINKAKNVRLITSNGSINSELNTLVKDTHFDLETSMGNIELDFPNLIYKVNNQMNLGIKKIVAHSTNFDENKDHLKYFASTSNGSITIY